MQSFLAVLAEEEMAEAMESPTHSQNELGVNQMDKPHQCGHIFCRRDIVKWISEGVRPTYAQGLLQFDRANTVLIVEGHVPNMSQESPPTGLPASEAQGRRVRGNRSCDPILRRPGI
jgi:hypothetical protein